MIINQLIRTSGYTPAVAALWSRRSAAGACNGDPVTVWLSFTDQYGAGMLPARGAYTAAVLPSQAASVSVSDKMSTGCSVTLPPASDVTLAAEMFDALVHSCTSSENSVFTEKMRADRGEMHERTVVGRGGFADRK